MRETNHARQLRQAQTDAECNFWFNVRNRRLAGYKFRRQVPIGPYIADFVCESRKLIVELDGGGHAEETETDRERDEHLRSKGYEVLRIWNNEVMTNMDGVRRAVLVALGRRSGGNDD
jgi:very-short-patch-repair endonuclease